MKCTLPLSRQLQSPKLDVGQVEDMAQATVLAIEPYRNEENFSSIFKESVKIINTKIIRITARSTQSCNIPETNLKACYRIGFYYPFIDCLVQELKDRFESEDNLVGHLKGLTPGF
ncbi:hypothetical protein PR048_023800 [Dryococelus australis]|uniref:Uncharacterized protein n=1 Tax=Dryococelus australis TaxID=614101 RepID=A0ABQ9GV21_9NEOP|nr:hypothetical protein PR048_023800 [Dryococelus australis]